MALYKIFRLCLASKSSKNGVFLTVGPRVAVAKKCLRHKYHTNVRSTLKLSEEVSSALGEGRPVVALESTIITHGMPYPENVQTAVEVENIVRQFGAIPATVAVIKGNIHVGLSMSQLEWLASEEAQALKVSRRDLAYSISQKRSGGTTVAGTMLAAHLAGISVFVTGGIGGVHRDAENTMDVSADLRELGRTPVAVVSAGVKSILDIPKTLEYLETEGVGVYSYGPTTDFPAFFTPRSGCHAPYNLQTPTDAAKVIDATLTLDLQSGLLIAVPIPETEAADHQEVNVAIETATEEAKSQGVTGKRLTPFLLDRINDLMKGKSLKANISLIKNNAKVGSQIAVTLADLRKGQGEGRTSAPNTPSPSTPTSKSRRSESRPGQGRVVVVGGTNVDFTARFDDQQVESNGATYPGSVKQSFGGVGRNLADGLARLGQNPVFLSAIGQDNYLHLLTKDCPHMDLSHIRTSADHQSATYCAILDAHGDLINGIGDFNIHQQITEHYVSTGDR